MDPDPDLFEMLDPDPDSMKSGSTDLFKSSSYMVFTFYILCTVGTGTILTAVQYFEFKKEIIGETELTTVE